MGLGFLDLQFVCLICALCCRVLCLVLCACLYLCPEGRCTWSNKRCRPFTVCLAPLAPSCSGTPGAAWMECGQTHAQARRCQALAAAIQSRSVFSDACPSAILLDLDLMADTVAALLTAGYPAGTLHTFAVKVLCTAAASTLHVLHARAVHWVYNFPPLTELTPPPPPRQTHWVRCFENSGLVGWVQRWVGELGVPYPMPLPPF